MALFWDFFIVHPPRFADAEKCLICGYWLHGLPRIHAARCPECGSEVPATYSQHISRLSQQRISSGIMLLSCGQLFCAIMQCFCFVIGIAMSILVHNNAVRIGVLNSISETIGCLGLIGFGAGLLLVSFSGWARRCWSPYWLSLFCAFCALFSPSFGRA